MVDWVRVAAITGLFLDGVTTWYVLANDDYVEFNPILDGLWTVHPLLVAAYFGGVGLIVGTGCTRRLGWLSTALAVYVAVVMGVFGGLNNLELITLGAPSFLGMLADLSGVSGPRLTLYAIPSVGIVAGLGVARLRHGQLS
jgi:hypothetical protein